MELDVALRSAAADAFKTIAKAALQEAGVECARVIGALRTCAVGKAGLHFAAAAAFLSVATAYGVVGFYATPAGSIRGDAR